jgi:tetratricopeptide (TPR) repeat protein
MPEGETRMENKEKLIDLIEKEEESTLSPAEISGLESMLDDPDNLEFYNTYKKIKNSVNRDEHLSRDTLSDYILLKNGLEPVNNEIVSALPRIENHLRSCHFCLNEFKVLNEELHDISSFIKSPAEEAEKNKPVPLMYRRPLSARYGIFTVLAIGLLYLSAFIISQAVTPGSYKYAQIKDEPDYYTMRGRMTGEFQASLNALENGEYSSAIASLERDIKNNTGDAAIFYSHYILGLAYLETSEKNILGLFPSYDETAANKGLKNLERAIELNNTGRYQNIALDAYFYKAKALLMLGRVNDARNDLQYVVKNRGSKINEAQDILKQME